MTSPTDDKPTARALHLELDRLTTDEVAMLVFLIETLLNGELLCKVGGDEPVLERMLMKLKAHRAGKSQQEAS